ncbi:MAG: hypothetical protein HY905_17050 [Deltaproteobacteria bacterium]|nr:hypothetical protein [Deltaproteobacteria bacterium]
MKASHLFVVDADVLQASGTSERPPAPECLRTLNTILTVCHRVAVSPAIQKQWNEHASQAARRWWRQMLVRRKVVPLAAEDVEKCIAPGGAAAGLQRSIDRHFGEGDERDESLRDVLLVTAAVAAQAAILSNDRKARRRFRTVAQTCAALRTVEWSNPCEDADEVVPWLERGAPMEKGRQLGCDEPDT